MGYSCIVYETRGNVGIVKLNRIEALNAVNVLMLQELAQQVLACEQNENIRAIIITGCDKTFAAGIDIKELSTRIVDDTFDMNEMRRYFDFLEKCTKPLIAAVSGYALGIGCEIALACDILLASDNARFGQPEISLGITPGFGACSRLCKTIGKAKTMEMVLTGRALSAQEAFESGIVSRIVALPDLFEESIRTASRIAAQPQHAVLLAKENIKQALNQGMQNGIDFENKNCRISLLSKGFRDILNGFMAKNPKSS